MLIVISPTLERMIVELALGRDVSLAELRWPAAGSCRPLPNTMADRAADLLAATSALDLSPGDPLVGHARGRAAHRPDPGAGRRADRRPERGRRLALGELRAAAAGPARTRRPRCPATGSPRPRSSGRSPRPSGSAC